MFTLYEGTAEGTKINWRNLFIVVAFIAAIVAGFIIYSRLSNGTANNLQPSATTPTPITAPIVSPATIATPAPTLTTAPTPTSGDIIKITPEKLWGEFSASRLSTVIALEKYGGKTVEMSVAIDSPIADFLQKQNTASWGDDKIWFMLGNDFKKITPGKTYTIRGDIASRNRGFINEGTAILIENCSIISP